MSNSSVKGPSRPWWKEPWPWILIALIGTAMAASIVTVVIASRSADEELAPSEPGDGPVRSIHHVHNRSLQAQGPAREDGQRPPAAGYKEGPAASK